MDITDLVVTKRNESLLVGDHNTYHAKLTRRLLNLRRQLGRTQPSGKRYQAPAPITPEDIAGNNAFAHLLLFTAERAWAVAMHLKSTGVTTANAEDTTRFRRRNVVSHLARASKIAHELLQILQNQAISGASDKDILEARAYASSMTGAQHFEKQRWEQCLAAYAETHIIYSALVASTTKNDAFRDLLSTIVDPSIRYAAYKCNIPRSVPVRAIARRYLSSSDTDLLALVQKQAPKILAEDASDEHESSPKTITWRSRTVDIEDAYISSVLLSVETASNTLSERLSLPDGVSLPPEEKAAAYDDVLSASQDALDATRRAIKDLATERVGQDDKRMQALQIARTAVNYALIGWRIGRNRVLVGEQDGAIMESRPVRRPRKSSEGTSELVQREEGTGRKLARLRERVVLYDAIIQSIGTINSLPGVAADESLQRELKAKQSYFQALKCLSIARSHSLRSRPRETLALLSRATDLATAALSTLSPPQSSAPPPSRGATTAANLDIHPETLHALDALLKSELTRQHALVDLSARLSASDKDPENVDDDDDRAPTRSLVETLDQYPPRGKVDLANLVTYPPRLEPVPVKPLFLDVAWNYIEYPGRDNRRRDEGVVGNAKVLEAGGKAKEVTTTEKGKEAGRRGWFGFGR